MDIFNKIEEIASRIEAASQQLDELKRLSELDSQIELTKDIISEVIEEVQNAFDDDDFESVLEAELEVDAETTNVEVRISKTISSYERDNLVERICKQLISELQEKGVIK